MVSSIPGQAMYPMCTESLDVSKQSRNYLRYIMKKTSKYLLKYVCVYVCVSKMLPILDISFIILSIISLFFPPQNQSTWIFIFPYLHPPQTPILLRISLLFPIPRESTCISLGLPCIWSLWVCGLYPGYPLITHNIHLWVRIYCEIGSCLECIGKGDNVLNMTRVAHILRLTINVCVLWKMKIFLKAKNTLSVLTKVPYWIQAHAF